MIGIDIEDVARFKNLDDHFVNRVYTMHEIEYCKKHQKSYVHFAGFWCAKEAVVKALNDFDLVVSDVEILHNKNGAPYINITPKIKQCLTNKNMQNIAISISHTDTVATAIAMLC